MKQPPKIEMLLTDCMDFMAGQPDNAFDLAIVDPPYGIDYLHSGGLGTNCKDKKHNRRWHDRKKWDKYKPDEKYFNNLFRVSKNQIIWGGNYFTEYIPPSMGWVVWDKGQKLTMSDGELAFTSFSKALRVIVLNRVELLRDGVIHPTQKPVALYKWLLTNYAQPGDKILDTHGGSGSICIACHDLGFDLTWMEKDEDYYNAAVERYKRHAAQLQMF